MIKKLIAIVVAFIAAVQLMADTQSDWYASLSSKHEATSVSVGKETWNASDKNKPLPYRFSCGAVLHSTLGGKRLDLNNIIIADGGIWADGDLAILLAGNNYIPDGYIETAEAFSAYSLLIFGPGALTVKGGQPIYSSELAICAGASVTVHGRSWGYSPISGRKLLVSASSLSVFAPEHSTTGINVDTVNIIGSAVAVFATASGLDSGTIVIDGSVVNILSEHGAAISSGTLVCEHSYLACVGGGSYSAYDLKANEAYFDNSLVKLYSKSNGALTAGSVIFGEGNYFIASGYDYRTVGAYDMTIKGGNVQICSANEESSAVETENFQIDAGRLEIVDNVDVREFLKYDATAAAAFTGALASGIDVTSLMANFYSQVILDAISNGKIGNLNGVPNVGIDCYGSSDAYIQNGGTVWCNLPKYGVMCYKPVVNGGSYKGQFYNPSYSYTVSGGHDPVSPVNSSGILLKSMLLSHGISGSGIKKHFFEPITNFGS